MIYLPYISYDYAADDAIQVYNNRVIIYYVDNGWVTNTSL